jgi:two-component system, NtrC family, response regulator PilR
VSAAPRALVVDDEPDLRELLRLELEGAGWVVQAAENGRAAWALLQAQPVDVVLTDLRMPGGSGVDLARKLHARGGPPPEVFLMSAYDDVSADEVFALGARELIPKPFDFEDVARRLARAIGR